MSMSSCSNCIAGDNDWLKLRIDLLIINFLEPQNLNILIEQLLIENRGLKKSILSEIYNLNQRGYPLSVTLLSEKLSIPQSISEKRAFAREVRMLNFKLLILSGNISNLQVQLICSPPD